MFLKHEKRTLTLNTVYKVNNLIRSNFHCLYDVQENYILMKSSK